jgi:hypothetical protein
LVPDAKVDVRGKDFARSSPCDHEGNLIVAGLAPGRYAVAAEATGFPRKRKQVTISNADARVPIELTRSDGPTPGVPEDAKAATLLVQVLKPRPRARPKKVAGAKVDLYSAGRRRRTEYTDADGMVTFSPLPRSGYEVRVKAAGFPQEVQRADLRRGDLSMQVLLSGPVKSGDIR